MEGEVKPEFAEKIKSCTKAVHALYRQQRFADAEEYLLSFKEGLGDADKDGLTSLLLDHYYLTSQHEKALTILRSRIKDKPNNTELRIAIAEYYHYHDKNLDRADELVELALECAIANGEFVRQVLGIRARVAKEKGDYLKFKDTLKMLLIFETARSGLDVGLEKDFIKNLPAEVARDNIIKMYRKLF